MALQQSYQLSQREICERNFKLLQHFHIANIKVGSDLHFGYSGKPDLC